MTNATRSKSGSQHMIGGMLVLVLLATGCTPLVGGWDVSKLEPHASTIAEFEGNRLGDTPPYFLPHGNSALLFLCRFRTDAPIAVSMPDTASAEQLAAIRLALEGWANAGLGIEFVEAQVSDAVIDIRIVTGALSDRPGDPRPQRTGYTVSECEVDPRWHATAKVEGPLPVSLARATVVLRTSNTNMVGREVSLTQDELVGTALHELGHALGFPGHLATLDGVMTKSTDTVRRVGRELREGRGFRSPTLAALYALPNGTLVGQVDFAPGESAVFDRAMRRAEGSGWPGPIIRVGEEHAAIHWHDGAGRRRTLRMPGYHEMLRTRQPLRFASGRLESSLRALKDAAP